LTRFPRPRDGHVALLRAALATSYGTVGNRFIAQAAARGAVINDLDR